MGTLICIARSRGYRTWQSCIGQAGSSLILLLINFTNDRVTKSNQLWEKLECSKFLITMRRKWQILETMFSIFVQLEASLMLDIFLGSAKFSIKWENTLLQGFGIPGDINHRRDGRLSYAELCTKLRNKTKIIYDAKAVTLSLTDESGQWYSFEQPQHESFHRKVSD